MGQLDVKQELIKKFSEPLRASHSRRIVIWNDSSKEFEQILNDLIEEGITNGEGEPVVIYNTAPGHLFQLKKAILRDNTAQDCLIYQQCGKHEVDGNWLADVSFYADHFQADYASMRLNQINARDTDDIRKVLSSHSNFFNAQTRIKKYLQYFPITNNTEDMLYGMLATVLRTKTASIEELITAFLVQISDDLSNDISVENLEVISQLQKFDLLNGMQKLLFETTHYQMDSLEKPVDLFAHILFSALAASAPYESLYRIHGLISQEHANQCLSIVHEWMQHDKKSLSYACELVDQEYCLNDILYCLVLKDLQNCDVFPQIDAFIINSLLDALIEDTSLINDIEAISQTRKNLFWFDDYRIYYECLSSASNILRFMKEYADGYKYDLSKRIWNTYINDWWRMDYNYRKFHQRYQICKDSWNTFEDKLKELATRIDRIYSNGFVSQINTLWNKSIDEDMQRDGHINGIDQQTDFFMNYVYNLSDANRLVVVGICDGMRYEIAQELNDRLQANMRGNSKITAMQGIFPSITKTGMAALLPHRQIKIVGEDLDVLIDNKPTVSTQNREEILRVERPHARCISFKDLNAMSSSEREDLAKDAQVVYVYQNTIDKHGHDDDPHQLMRFIDEAINNMEKLVDIATRDMHAQNVLITADHGFLYRNDKPAAESVVSSKLNEGKTISGQRRYLVTENGESRDYMYVDMSAYNNEFAWLAARTDQRIKTSGSSLYVHGGISLQELCVPVVQYSNIKSGKSYIKTEHATINLIDSNHSITSTIFQLKFFQTNGVGGKVLPAEYELVMVDESNAEVSDTRKVVADIQESVNQNERTHTVKFTLKSGITWDSKANYYLICRRNNKEEWRETFKINIAFAPATSFEW